jgi:hypothetical protein
MALLLLAGVDLELPLTDIRVVEPLDIVSLLLMVPGWLGLVLILEHGYGRWGLFSP